MPIINLPAGVRLDTWPAQANSTAPQDPPAILGLKEELRRSMPELAVQLESLAVLRQIRDLASRVAGPQPAKLITRHY